MSEFLNAQTEQPPEQASGASGTTDKQVAKLSRDMINFDARLSTLINLLNASPIFNPPPPDPNAQNRQQGSSTHQVPPDPHQTGNKGDRARFSQPQPDLAFHHFTGQEFDHLKRIEPLKIPDLWFAGNAVQLTSFLRSIQEFL
ncbi:hypothetical protein PCASD_10710 [Puccinia coronata f. sp. avenae]|uniref:Uncharacterized protein n=1 Tax=Puccinia coronata f. sp. avenae TaxID=200324 RepID=A0A2N5UQ00_9BASI|nr:hypothetical protein PCASD_21934 [Puccinia coronata f. sp. avenae]PLW39821.1 hypothetical protein PCASD_10710 [Puccinia coronata f. sp. avenae]